MVFLFSLPLTMIHLPAYLIWDRFKNRAYALFLFPLVAVIMEWLQYTCTPFASWGVAAYTQSHSITLLQTLSLFGLAGLSFLIYWINIAITDIIRTKKLHFHTFCLPAGLLIVAFIYGSLRMDFVKSKTSEMVTVAAIGTDSDVSGLPLPDETTNNGFKNKLLERTIMAAEKGAKVVVWNEASVVIQKEHEKSWQDAIKAVVNDTQISLIASYIVPLSTDPLQYENKLLYINSKGEIEYCYMKHQPVPGEPSIKGNEPFKTMTDNGLKIGGAICYDFDYPYIARAYGKLDVNLVAVPSSDWRGIDPLHTSMATFRAIEQGYSVLRSTRFGLSASINPLGEMTTRQSSFDKTPMIMTGELPIRRITTLYSLIGDAFVYVCMGFLALF
jgi:apolipoprotein N-acyltransferase